MPIAFFVEDSKNVYIQIKCVFVLHVPVRIEIALNISGSSNITLQSAGLDWVNGESSFVLVSQYNLTSLLFVEVSRYAQYFHICQSLGIGILSLCVMF